MSERRIPYSELEPKDHGMIKEETYTVKTRDGQEMSNWSEIALPDGRVLRHTAVIDDERNTGHDVIEIGLPEPAHGTFNFDPPKEIRPAELKASA